MSPAQLQRNRDAARRVSEKAAAAYAALVEDVEWLAQSGCTRREIAQRLGYRNVESLERHLWRHGYPVASLPR